MTKIVTLRFRLDKNNGKAYIFCMNYLHFDGNRIRGGTGDFKRTTRKVRFPRPEKGDYNMRIVVPAKAWTQLQIEGGNPWEFKVSEDKQKLLCELALYRTPETTDTIVLSNGVRQIHVPARYKPFITEGTQALWFWNRQEVYGQIPLTEFQVQTTTNPFAINRERKEERKYRLYEGKPRKVPIWKGK